MKYDKTIKFLEKALKHFRDKRKSLMPEKRRYRVTFTIRCKITGITRTKIMTIEAENTTQAMISIGRKITGPTERVIWAEWLLLD